MIFDFLREGSPWVGTQDNIHQVVTQLIDEMKLSCDQWLMMNQKERVSAIVATPYGQRWDSPAFAFGVANQPARGKQLGTGAGGRPDWRAWAGYVTDNCNVESISRADVTDVTQAPTPNRSSVKPPDPYSDTPQQRQGSSAPATASSGGQLLGRMDLTCAEWKTMSPARRGKAMLSVRFSNSADRDGWMAARARIESTIDAYCVLRSM